MQVISKKTQSIQSALLCGALVLSACGAHAAAQVDIDRYLGAAEQSRADGRADDTYRILSELVRMAPDDEQVNMAYGLACLEIGDPSRAELAFRRVLELNPDNQRARLELARALTATKQYEEARAELRRVLASDPPPRVMENIRTYLANLPSEYGTAQSTGRLQLELGVFHDSNVNVGPDTSIIRIEPIYLGSALYDSLEVGEDSRPKADSGVSLTGRGTWARDLEWSRGWQAEFGAVVSAYKMLQETDYDLMYGQLQLAMVRKQGSRLVHMPLRYAYISRGGEGLMQSASVGSLFTQGFRSNSQRVSLRTDVQWRDYLSDPDRDGLYAYGGGAFDQFVGQKRHLINTGVTYFRDFAEEPINRRKGVSITLNGSFNLPWRSACYCGVNFLNEQYDERAVLAPETREDQQTQLVAGIRKITRARTYLDLRYQHTDNRSTFDLYDYQRDVTTLSVGYSF